MKFDVTHDAQTSTLHIKCTCDANDGVLSPDTFFVHPVSVMPDPDHLAVGLALAFYDYIATDFATNFDFSKCAADTIADLFDNQVSITQKLGRPPTAAMNYTNKALIMMPDAGSIYLDQLLAGAIYRLDFAQAGLAKGFFSGRHLAMAHNLHMITRAEIESQLRMQVGLALFATQSLQIGHIVIASDKDSIGGILPTVEKRIVDALSNHEIAVSLPFVTQKETDLLHRIGHPKFVEMYFRTYIAPEVIAGTQREAQMTSVFNTYEPSRRDAANDDIIAGISLHRCHVSVRDMIIKQLGGSQ